MNVLSDKQYKIFDTTLKLIAEHGLHNTPMSLVSKQSGVSTGAIYHHFNGKEHLINELYLYVKQELIDNIFENVDSSQGFKEKFHKIWSNYFYYLIKNPDILSFIEQCSISPIISDKTRKEAEKFSEPLIVFFENGIQNNQLNNNEIELILAIVNSNVVALAKLFLSGMLSINQDTVNKAISISLKGLAK
jgi:AcrR family transcriptional regulator